MSFLWGNTANQQQDTKKFANISNDQINSNQQAVPVPYLAGRMYVAGNYISPAYNPKAVPVKSQSGKGQSTTTGYKYYADFALVFCTGGRRPVDGVYTVIVDSDIRWSGSVTRGNAEKEKISVPGLGDMYLYWGNETQSIDQVLLSARPAPIGTGDKQDNTTWATNHQGGATQATGADGVTQMDAGDPNPYSGHYDRHPAYRGQCYAVFKGWLLGRDRTAVPNIQLELSRGCPAPWLSGGGTPMPPSDDARGVNPIAVLYDWLTDTRFGMGIPNANLNIPTFTSAYNTLEALAGGPARISPLVTQQTDFRQAIADLLQYFDGWIRRNGSLIEVGVWKLGTIAPGPLLTDDDLLADPELEPQGFSTTFNELTVVYKDRAHHYNDYVQVYRDSNNFRVVGGPRTETFQRPYITDVDTAKQYARLTGAVAALPTTRGELTVKREWLTDNNMLPGMVFTYNSVFYGPAPGEGLHFLMRLIEVEHEADKSAEAKITVEWERSQWPTIYIPKGLHGPGGFVLGPRAIWQYRITEVPYLLADQKFDTQLIFHAVRGNVEVQGFRTWISLDAGATYQMVPDDTSSSSFSSFGKLTATMSGVTTYQRVDFNLFGIDLDLVVTQTAAEQGDDTLLLFIDGEVLSVGAVNAQGHGLYRANALRGRFDTAVTSHAIGAQCFFLFRNRMKLIDNAGFIPGTAIKVKLQPFTADLDYDLTSVTPIDYVIVGFADIPPPTLSPSAGTFVGSVVVTLGAIPAGCTARYTTGGAAVTGSSPLFPAIHHITLLATTTIRIRFYSTNGQSSPELVATYTKIPAGPGQPNPQCGVPSWTFSGVLYHTGGNITLTATTPGSIVHWTKTSEIAPYTTSGSGNPTQVVALLCNQGGDQIEFWAEQGGFDPSQHVTIDNTRETTYGGGGHFPPRSPP